MWWECPKGLSRELSKMWRSTKAPYCSVRLFWHSSPYRHSNSGLGISLWETFEVSHRVYTGLLLQYTQYWYLCTSICHNIQRCTYRNYPGTYIRGTTCSEGNASCLTQLYASSDYVHRQVYVLLLWGTFHMGWEVKHPMLGLYKRSEIP